MNGGSGVSIEGVRILRVIEFAGFFFPVFILEDESAHHHPGKVTAGSPKNHPIEKEHHLPSTSFLGSRCFSFSRVFCLL